MKTNLHERLLAEYTAKNTDLSAPQLLQLTVAITQAINDHERIQDIRLAISVYIDGIKTGSALF